MRHQCIRIEVDEEHPGAWPLVLPHLFSNYTENVDQSPGFTISKAKRHQTYNSNPGPHNVLLSLLSTISLICLTNQEEESASRSRAGQPSRSPTSQDLGPTTPQVRLELMGPNIPFPTSKHPSCRSLPLTLWGQVCTTPNTCIPPKAQRWGPKKGNS